MSRSTDDDDALRAALGEHSSLARALGELGVSFAQLEASVRRDDTALRGDRMMIERAPEAAIDAVLDAFHLPRTAHVDALTGAARTLGLPLIAGWDTTRGCAKLYLNASDASLEVRSSAAALVGATDPAHVIGVNTFADGHEELKLYVQAAEASAPTLGPEARRLLSAAGDLGAGVVISRHSDGAPHAFFVALRPASPETLDAAFQHLPGFSWAALRAGAPFEPASPRSIGIAWERSAFWTAYVKPRAVEEPELWTLEPTATFGSPEGELGIYVSPDAEAPRAYARVGGVAISYRARRGDPSPELVTTLLDWAVGVLSDPASRESAADALASPPEPWARLS